MKLVAPEIDTPEHWRLFAQFCEREKATGGPDPHLSYIVQHSAHETEEERLWRGGCYIACYTSPMAWVLWHSWSPQAVTKDPDAVEQWLRDHWKRGVVMRQERRCVRTPAKLARFLVDYAAWMQEPRDWKSYDEAWESVNRIHNVGRYMAMKLLEYCYRAKLTEFQLHDLRPQGGWSPRRAMATLWPDFEGVLLTGGTPVALAQVNTLADVTRRMLHGIYGVDVTAFELQVMLCEYREAYENLRQYPGRSHDIELAEYHRLERYWGESPLEGFLDIRASHFPRECLGEHGSWVGVREELSRCVRLGYLWLDTLYDYTQTRLHHAWTQPIPRVDYA